MARLGFPASLIAWSAVLPLLASAQVLDDVDSVHPSWTLSQLRPKAWKVQVAGLEWLPDGRLLVLEHTNPNENPTGTPHRNGKLWLVENPSDTGEAIRYRPLVDSLKEPVGLISVNGKIFVSEKTELSEFTPDPQFAKVVKSRTVARIPHDSLGKVNFQEYAFGALYKDGYFYVASAGAVKQGGKSFDSLPDMLNESRAGGLLKIKESDGSLELLAGGMRANNGIAWGPEGSIWISDNQGSYRPASQLTAVETGANYGYPNKPNAFLGKPVTPPSIWAVHGEIAQSPTYPHLVKKGLYAGQFLVGDLSLGGIKRAFVEKVNGAWQGAIFSFTGGLEVGIESMVEGDDGTLYVGGFGRGDANNWGWRGKTWGLQKLTPKPGKLTFEILAIRSRRTGMEIEFTKPLGPEGGLASSYEVRAGTMNPQSGYGVGYVKSPAPLAIKSVSLSPDRKRAFLELNGLAERTVLTIKAAGARSEAGESARCPAGWYTLNAISQSEPFSGATGIADPGRRPLAADLLVQGDATGLRVSVLRPGGHRISIRTLAGRIVASRTGWGAADYHFTRTRSAAGLYWVEIRSGGETYRKAIPF